MIGSHNPLQSQALPIPIPVKMGTDLDNSMKQTQQMLALSLNSGGWGYKIRLDSSPGRQLTSCDDRSRCDGDLQGTTHVCFEMWRIHLPTPLPLQWALNLKLIHKRKLTLWLLHSTFIQINHSNRGQNMLAWALLSGRFSWQGTHLREHTGLGNQVGSTLILRSPERS